MLRINQCIITITRACNLRCNFCYAKETGYKTNEFITMDSIKRLIDFCSASRVNFVVLTGGEPLLYPELPDILRYIKTRPHKMTTAIPTNGILFSDYEFCKRIIESGLDYADISMKGKDSQEWLNVTGYDGFTKQMKAIRNLSGLSIDFTCSMVITHENVETFCETVEHAYDSGGRKFSFTFVIDNEKNKECGQKYLEQNNPLMLIDRFISQVNRLTDITQGEWWLEYSFPLCIYTNEQLQKLKGRLAAPCHVHEDGSLTFDARLNLIPCSMFIKDIIGKFGEDFSSLSELESYMHTDSYMNIMNSLNRYPSDECEICADKNKCLGGCPCFWEHCTFEEFRKFKRDEILKLR